MENSNTLPVIEVGDTVIFRTDLVDGKMYGRLQFHNAMYREIQPRNTVVELGFNCFRTDEDGFSYTPEMVAQVIKPTKERVYTEEEMRTAIELARDFKRLEYPFPDYEYGYTPDKIIESLNK